MTDDLVVRLRCYPANRLCRQVADALEAKDARIAKLEAALKPFAAARHMEGLADWIDDGTVIGCNIQARDLRAARAAYLGEKE